jgi:hypothetical protein
LLSEPAGAANVGEAVADDLGQHLALPGGDRVLAACPGDVIGKMNGVNAWRTGEEPAKLISPGSGAKGSAVRFQSVGRDSSGSSGPGPGRGGGGCR